MNKMLNLTIKFERLVRLNDIAKKQMELLKKNKSLKNLEYIENKINNNLLVDTK